MEEIKVKVKTKDVLSITYLNRLQGDLKVLSDENYKKLKNEILTEGFCFAIHVWENKDDAKIYILDGTQRLETLTRMKEEGYSIPQIPVVFIEADNINDAKKILLGGASQYGEFNQKGAEDFISTIEGIDVEYLNNNISLNNIDYENISFEKKEEITQVTFDAKTNEKIKEIKDKDQFLILITCENENHQKIIFNKLESEGIKCNLI